MSRVGKQPVAIPQGVTVSVDDWKFDAWTPGEDFTADKY